VPVVIASILSAIESGRISDISTETDFTWHRAVDFYVNGEKEKAFFLLGHILHLVEDASVPDHTRNDTHTNDSPYERWTAQFSLSNRDPGLATRLFGKNPIQLNQLDMYFDDLAAYSNNNFYSVGTVGLQSGYKSPEPDYFSNCGDYMCGIKSDELGNYKVIVKTKEGLLNSIYSSKNTTSIFFEKAGGDIVIKDYWSRLSTKAVQYSAGVIDLFIKEAEVKINDPNFKKQEEQKSFIASIKYGAQGVISTVAKAVQGVIGALENILKQDNVQTGKFQVDAPLEGSVSEVNVGSLEEETTSEGVILEQVEEELTTSEEVRENVEEFQGSPDVVLTESEKAIVVKMLARLDDLMKQAAEMKNRAEVMATAELTSREAKTTQFQAVSTLGGGNPQSSGSGGANSSVAASSTQESSNQSNNNSTTTPQNATSTNETTPISTSLSDVLISEIFFNASGTDAGKEFIELYNPNSQSAELSGWSLKYTRSDSTSTISLASFKAVSHSEDVATIPARGFLLIGLNSYESAHYGKIADVVRTTSLPNGGAGEESLVFTVSLTNASGTVVDSMNYSASSIGVDGESLERKAKSDNGCVSASGGGEFLGNGCEATSIDAFERKTRPTPQNSSSLPEPRAVPRLSDTTVSYSSSSVSLSFGWSESSDSSGATSTILYEVRYSDTGEVFATTTGATSLEKGISEIGRDFSFTLRAVDRDGLNSATTSLSVLAPSFFDGLYFYADPRSSDSQKMVDAYYSGYPLVPGRADVWKIALFYLDSEPSSDHIIRSDSPQGLFMPSGTSTPLSLNYPRCSGSTYPNRFLLLPDTSAQCNIFGGGLYPISFPVPEDKHFIIPSDDARVSSISTSSYVTVAFYDFSENWPSYTSFRLVATDKQRYYFRESAPSSTPPLPPADLSTQFDDFHSRLGLSWPRATDADSLDSSLSYRLNYSTTTDFSASIEWSVGTELTSGISVTPGYPYKIRIMSVDDFGNISSSTEKGWDFPDNFVQLPFQRESGGLPIGKSDGNGQKILISSSTSSVSKVAMVMAMDGGAYSVTDTFVEIRADNSGEIGDLVATSFNISRHWPMSDQPIRDEFIFNFPQPVPLSANTYYWLVPRNGPGISNLNFIYGTSTDIYPDGYWSGNPSADAYFFIR
jgi:hypothetical protein